MGEGLAERAREPYGAVLDLVSLLPTRYIIDIRMDEREVTVSGYVLDLTPSASRRR